MTWRMGAHAVGLAMLVSIRVTAFAAPSLLPVGPRAGAGQAGGVAVRNWLVELAAGKTETAAPWTIDVRDQDAAFHVTIHGSGVAFVSDTQVRLAPRDMAEMAKLVLDGGLPDMPGTFGGVGGPGRGVPERLVRSIRLHFAGTERSVTQLAGGEQSAALAELVGALRKRVEPLAEKGLKLADLSLEQAVEGLSKGDVAPEALSLAMTYSPRGKPGPNRVFRFTDATLMVMVDGPVNKPLTRAQTDALARRIGTLLTGKSLDKMPLQLWWPDALIGLHIQVRGQPNRLDLSADVGPYNQRQKAAHPDAQKAFDQIIAGLRQIETEMIAKNP